MDARFDHVANICPSTRYKGNRNYFWPPLGQYTVHALDIAGFADSVPHAITAELDILRDSDRGGMEHLQGQGCPLAHAYAFCRGDRSQSADALRRPSRNEQDRHALEKLRADAVRIRL